VCVIVSYNSKESKMIVTNGVDREIHIVKKGKTTKIFNETDILEDLKRTDLTEQVLAVKHGISLTDL
jgi:hypothetical protein